MVWARPVAKQRRVLQNALPGASPARLIMLTTCQEAPGAAAPLNALGRRRIGSRGNPAPKHVSTSYGERQNLTMRMSMRRFTRLRNAFSKKPDNHIHALALYFAFYNFCRIHKTLRMSPAMAAGITDRLWSLEDIVEKIDAMAPAPKSRGPYKKRAA